VAGHEPDVRVAWQNIDRRLMESEEVFVLLAHDDQQGWPAPETMQAVEAAVQHANDSAEIWAMDNPVTAGLVRAGNVDPTPLGPVIYIDDIGTEYDNHRWLGEFAQLMQRAGYDGDLDVAPRASIPAWGKLVASLGPAAYLAYRTQEQPTPISWQPAELWSVDAETTADICERLREWASLPRADVYLKSGMTPVKIDDPDPCGQLIRAMELTYTASVGYVRRTPLQVRRAQLSWAGQMVTQIEDPQLDWSAKIDALTQTLRWHPDRLDLAFIRLTRAWASSWIDLARGFTKLPHVSEGHVRMRRDLWSQYSPDAHGVQILTDDHLARANNLDSWHVQLVAPARYLVQAKDLQPWYGTGTDPAPDVLATARADFGDLLLTPEVVQGT
jgi:hypothetical protein